MQKINFILAFIFTLSLQAQNQKKYKTMPLHQNIKTVMVHKEGWPLSDPVINIDGNERILVSFDDLSEEQTDYTYTLIHCNANWEKSFLSKSEYMQGFTENYFDYYDYSFNTNINYVHYQVVIPNENMRLTKSGNYALVVYETSKPENIVCVACFYVVKQQVKIDSVIDYNTMVDIKKTTQQINFYVKHPDVNIYDPHSETKIIVQQNQRTDNQVTDIVPTYTRPGLLIYEENNKLIFKGGNEYRHFDAVTNRFYGEGIYNIEYFNPYYHFTLYNDEPQDGKPYLFKYDHNGKFFIRRQEADQTALHLESDYQFIHFSIPMKDPILTGEIFLNGAFTYGAIDESTKMKYNFDTKCYELAQLLKQGYYNYRYIFKPTNQSTTSNLPIENDYYETENDYSIFFYFRPQSGRRYDQLIGYIKFNTQKRL